MQDKALQAGDIPTFFDQMADNVVVHVAGKNPLSGTYKGKAAVQESFAKWIQLSGEMTQSAHDILANDTHGVVMTQFTAKRGGKKLEAKGVSICHFAKGKISELWIFDQDQAASDAFYSA